jgi:hypothetical protein
LTELEAKVQADAQANETIRVDLERRLGLVRAASAA